jgi:capsular polysaccharide biosynthesis protein
MCPLRCRAQNEQLRQQVAVAQQDIMRAEAASEELRSQLLQATQRQHQLEAAIQVQQPCRTTIVNVHIKTWYTSRACTGRSLGIGGPVREPAPSSSVTLTAVLTM